MANKDIAKDIICAYLKNNENLASMSAYYEIASGNKEVLLEHIKAVKGIFERAIEEIKNE